MELLASPLAECRWCKILGEAEPNRFEPTKNPTWSIEILLDNGNKEHESFIGSLEKLFLEEHGKSAKKSNNWLACGPDKEDPEKTGVKFKVPCFTRKNGTRSQGPVVFDSQREHWPSSNLSGNGSKVIIAFDIYAWKGPSGAGITLQPKMMQVIELVEYSGGDSPEVDAVFEKIQGGYTLKDDPEVPF